jgi:hypothetical protein
MEVLKMEEKKSFKIAIISLVISIVALVITIIAAFI